MIMADKIIHDLLHANEEALVKPAEFSVILRMIGKHIGSRQGHGFTAEEQNRMRLAATLRFLHYGDRLSHLADLAQMDAQSLKLSMNRVLKAIWKYMKDGQMMPPKTDYDWNQLRAHFNDYLRLPNAVASVDAQVFRLKKEYVVCVAAVDAHGAFIYLNISDPIPNEQATVFEDAVLPRLFQQGIEHRAMLNPTLREEYFFVGNRFAHPSVHHAAQPHFGQMADQAVQRQYFYSELNRKRLPINATFSCMASKFLVLHHDVERHGMIKLILQACCVLHNFFSSPLWEPISDDFEPGPWPRLFKHCVIEFRPASHGNPIKLRMRVEATEL